MKLFERFELKKEALDIMEKQEIFDILTQIDRVFLKYEDDFITNNDWLDIQKLLGLNSKIILNPLIDYMNLYKAMSFVNDTLDRVYDASLTDTELLKVQNNFKKDISILQNHIKDLYNQQLQENKVLNEDIKQVLKKILPDGPLNYIPTINHLLSLNFNGNNNETNCYLKTLKEHLKIEIMEEDIKILLKNLINPINKAELKQILPNFVKELNYNNLAKNFGINPSPQQRLNDIIISSCKQLDILNHSIALEESLMFINKLNCEKNNFNPF